MNEKVQFAEIVSQFLDEWCKPGANLSVSQLALFKKFRIFWAQASQQWIHEASFHELNNELLRRGYRISPQGKRWNGFTLRKKPLSARQRRQ